MGLILSMSMSTHTLTNIHIKLFHYYSLKLICVRHCFQQVSICIFNPRCNPWISGLYIWERLYKVLCYTLYMCLCVWVCVYVHLARVSPKNFALFLEYQIIFEVKNGLFYHNLGTTVWDLKLNPLSVNSYGLMSQPLSQKSFWNQSAQRKSQ